MRERKPKAPPSRVARLTAAAFRKYAAELHRYIERRVREPEAGADLTQEIFERFLQVSDADAIRNPQAYLFGIASHVVREARFREDRSLVAYDSDMVEELGDQLAHALPDNIAQRLSLQQELQAAVRELPVMHRAVLLLVKRDGFSYEETAKKTGLSVNTVTSYLFEARAKVRTLLKRR